MDKYFYYATGLGRHDTTSYTGGYRFFDTLESARKDAEEDMRCNVAISPSVPHALWAEKPISYGDYDRARVSTVGFVVKTRHGLAWVSLDTLKDKKCNLDILCSELHRGGSA